MITTSTVIVRFDETNTTTLPKACVDNAVAVVCEADRKLFNPSIGDSDNRILASDGYEYDDNGNVTKDSEGRTFTYDALNKQVKAKNASNQVVGEYVYDGESKRVRKTSGNEDVVFVYDAFGKLVEEFSQANVQRPDETQITFLTTDPLGSPRVTTGESGGVVSRTDFLPFGEEISGDEGNRSTSLGYSGTNDIRQNFYGV